MKQAVVPLLLSWIVCSFVHAGLVVSEDFDGTTPGWSNNIAALTFEDPSTSGEGLFIQANSGSYVGFSGNTAFARDLTGEGIEPSLNPYSFVFESVDVSGFNDLSISFDYAVLANVDVGSYSVVVDGVTATPVEYFNDPDVALESGTVNIAVPTASTLGLVLSGTLNGGDDTLELDNFRITGTAVPEPSAFMLISLLGIGFAGRKFLAKDRGD